MKKVSILSIDGGGIRGIIPGTILTRLEEIIQEKSGNPELKLGDFFDFIAGTSTGGILACLYLCPGENGTARYSASQAVDLYLAKGHDIFSRKIVQRLRSGDGVFQEKYSFHSLFNQLEAYFGDTKLSELIKPCLITSYAITERKAVFFNSDDAKKGRMYNFLVKDVARATSAAPTYFEPAHIKSLNEKVWSLIDGGVYANNPTLCAYAEARKTAFSKILKDEAKPDKPSAKDMLIVSIGTGSVKKKYLYEKFEDAGELKWIQPLIDILMSGNSETVDYQLRQMFLTLEQENQHNYYRIEPPLCEAASEMDCVERENLLNLQQAGLTYIQDNDYLLQEIAEKVLANKTGS